MGRRGGASGGSGGGRVRPRRGDGRRPNRVGEVIRREIAAIVDDAFAQMPGFGGSAPVLVSVVDVHCSDDLRNARVGVSVLGTDDQKKLALAWLRDNKKLLRFELAACISSMKYVPELIFAESEVAQAVRAVNILDMLAKEREMKQNNNRTVGGGPRSGTSNSVTTSAFVDGGADDTSIIESNYGGISGDSNDLHIAADITDLDMDAMAENPFEEEEREDDEDASDIRNDHPLDATAIERMRAESELDDDEELDDGDDENIIDIDEFDEEYEDMSDATLLATLYKTLPDVTDLPGQWKIPRGRRQ